MVLVIREWRRRRRLGRGRDDRIMNFVLDLWSFRVF